MTEIANEADLVEAINKEIRKFKRMSQKLEKERLELEDALTLREKYLEAAREGMARLQGQRKNLKKTDCIVSLDEWKNILHEIETAKITENVILDDIATLKTNIMYAVKEAAAYEEKVEEYRRDIVNLKQESSKTAQVLPFKLK